MYFGCFQNMSIKVTPNFEKYGKCLKIFANTNSKCTCIREILPYVRGMKVLLGPCIHRKLYISSRVTPCIRAFEGRADENKNMFLLRDCPT